MTCTTCKISAAPFELRDGKCINCIYEMLQAVDLENTGFGYAIQTLRRQCGLGSTSTDCSAIYAYIDELQAKLELAQKDSARLDWLEASGNRSVGKIYLAGRFFWQASDYDQDLSKDGDTARQAIDAAMKAEKDQE